uniref:cytochrome P450 3A6-like n=1 Tax=Styela clava TaxID=7725 RepID=UPI00193A64E1|nr:cytochrome P450 3A6-like [Styela clava]
MSIILGVFSAFGTIIIMLWLHIKHKWKLLEKWNIPHTKPTFRNLGHMRNVLLAKDKNQFLKVGCPYMNNSVNNTTGQQWKRIRSPLSPSFSSGKLKQMASIVPSCTQNTISCLKLAKDGIFYPKRVIGDLTLDVICSAAFGVDLKISSTFCFLGEICRSPQHFGFSICLTRNEIIGNAIFMLIAGNDTTETTITFLLYNLSTHPQVQEKIIKEIDEVVAREGDLNYQNVNKIKISDMCVKETLRMYAPTLRNARCGQKDMRIKGFLFPKNVIIDISLYEIHHDPDIWDKPCEFRPESLLVLVLGIALA